MNNKCGAFIQFTFNFDRPAQFLHDRLDDIKANATARDLGNRDIPCTVEFFEQMRHGFQGDPHALVDDRYIHNTI